VTGFPEASCTTACSGICEPTATVVDGGVTDTEPTSAVGTTSVVKAHAAIVIRPAHDATLRAAGVRKR
jgi:hypothetical protein